MDDEQRSIPVLARISGSNKVAGVGGHRSFADPSVRQHIARASKFFIEQQDFDGVQLDIEPAPGGDPNYLKLLYEIRAAIGNKTQHVVAMKWSQLAQSVQGYSSSPH